MEQNKLIIGTAPDSWGVWFPEDDAQTPWQRFLDEVAEAGYRWIELGPYGYLPTDPQTLARELEQRGLSISAGTVFTAFHRGPEHWDQAWEPARRVAELTAAMGGRHVVVIPALWRDDKTGRALEDRTLTDAQWDALADGHNRLGERLQQEYGLFQQFHSHADSHVETMEQIERFLAATDPKLVTLCLDTGHAEYGGFRDPCHRPLAEVERGSPHQLRPRPEVALMRAARSSLPSSWAPISPPTAAKRTSHIRPIHPPKVTKNATMTPSTTPSTALSERSFTALPLFACVGDMGRGTYRASVTTMSTNSTDPGSVAATMAARASSATSRTSLPEETS